MPGTHRARRPARLLVLGAGVVIAVAVALAVLLLVRGSAPTPPPAGSSSTSGTPSSSPQPSPTKPGGSRPGSPASGASPTASGLPTVPPAAPQRLQVGQAAGVGFADAVRPDGGTAAPGSADLFARLATRGQPGSPGRDTVVVLGAAGVGGAAGAGPLGDTTLRPGAEAVLETAQGRMTYRVDTVHRVAARQLLGDPALQGRAPGRLVLVAAHQDPMGTPTGQDTLAVAQLTDAHRF